MFKIQKGLLGFDGACDYHNVRYTIHSRPSLDDVMVRFEVPMSATLEWRAAFNARLDQLAEMWDAKVKMAPHVFAFAGSLNCRVPQYFAETVAGRFDRSWGLDDVLNMIAA
jgi:hypothetical protein